MVWRRRRVGAFSLMLLISIGCGFGWRRHGDHLPPAGTDCHRLPPDHRGGGLLDVRRRGQQVEGRRGGGGGGRIGEPR